MECQEFLEGFAERLRHRLVLGPEPGLQLPQHPPRVGIAGLFQRRHQLPMRLRPIRLRQVPLQVPALVNSTALMQELLPEPQSGATQQNSTDFSITPS